MLRKLCCVPLRLASIVIGVVDLLFWSTVWIACIVAVARVSKDDTVRSIVCSLGLGVVFSFVIVAILLLVGIYLRNYKFVGLWLLVQYARIIIATILITEVLTVYYKRIDLVVIFSCSYISYLGYMIYCCWVINLAFKNLVTKNPEGSVTSL